MNKEIGAFEAKTRLAELLRQVQGGRRFTITHRGKPIADLVPCEPADARRAATAIAKFMAFKEANPVNTHVDVRALIEEGRE
jgi:prevent-host-death family protein